MAWPINYDDVRRQIEAAGIVLRADDLIVGSPRPQRRRVEGDREKRGWYRLFEMPLGSSGETVLVGSYGVWHGDDAGTRKIEISRESAQQFDAGERDAIAARIKADKARAERELAEQHERISARATHYWRQCQNAGSSQYLVSKGLPPGKLYGARLSPSNNLVVPIHDKTGRIWGLQVIYEDPAIKAKKGRGKDFSPAGLKKQGHWFLIGAVAPGGIALLCEGFATGCSLHEATGLPVVVAFDAGNLQDVAKAAAKHYRTRRILVCADDDWVQRCKPCGQYTRVEGLECEHCGQPHTKSNAGVRNARAAALAVDGHWVKPDFPTERPADRKGPTDFNDLHADPAGGLPLVARQIEAALLAMGWSDGGNARVLAHEGGGDDSTGRRRAVSIMDLDDLVQRFLPIDDGTGKHLFDVWTNRIVLQTQATALLHPGVRWDDVKRHPTWQGRGAYYIDQVGFDPSGKDPNVLLNTWRGWPIEAKPGTCELLLATLRYLCGGESNSDEVYDWLLRWMAFPLQNPGAKLNSAVIMHGPQGTGKSCVFQTLARIYGDYATVLNQRGLEDKFNSDWADSKLFLLAEEVVTRAEMWHIKNELKELVTGEWIRVNPKNLPAYRQRNQVNIVYLSNEGQPLPIENDDRRHLVIWTPPSLGQQWYDDVWREIDNGGVAALYHHLLQLDLGDFHPKKRPPMTEAKAELIRVSLPSEQRFLAEWGEGELGLPVCPCIAGDLYAAYLHWCRRNGESRPRPSNQFFNVVHRTPGWDKRKSRVYLNDLGASQPRPVIFPPTQLLQQHRHAQPDGSDLTRWLSDCVQLFSGAVRDPGGYA
ncbi:DUF5906 domain-containing protein [Chitiniphilus purpureus]|uniref:DUF5906 domain-containing protein n=1 Tax=Chitiniphilus purpureus TaxID=2981137 RepID=A0ABY6DHP7_9NEIS|nr:DUF5906 domain-containing protein [Chitiniphilus sp. CD1]UXY13846.1 DUF5906 domain-containing protein [Chitiniphilus sp. CD1]